MKAKSRLWTNAYTACHSKVRSTRKDDYELHDKGGQVRARKGGGSDWWLSLETKCRGRRNDDVAARDWLGLLPVVPPE